MAFDTVNPRSGPDYGVAVDDLGSEGVAERNKISFGAEGSIVGVDGAHGLPTQGSAAPLTILSVNTTLTDDTTPLALTADTDVRGFTHASVFLAQADPFTFSGAPASFSVVAYGSNDSTNWFRVPVIVQYKSGGNVVRQTFPELSTTAPGDNPVLNIIPIDFTYLRLMAEPTTGGPG